MEQDRHLIETKTVHAPLAGCFNVPLTGTGDGATTEFGEEHGLLCLERVIPDEVARGLWKLADTAVPFKAEVLRGRSSDGWLDGLVTEPFRAATGTTIVSALSSREHDRREKPRDDGAGLLRAQQSPPLEPALEAVRWLKGDVERIASLFSREVSAVEAPWPGWPRVVAAKRGVGETDVTVKIELLRKGKCPRFHLDRVSHDLPSMGLIARAAVFGHPAGSLGWSACCVQFCPPCVRALGLCPRPTALPS